MKVKFNGFLVLMVLIAQLTFAQERVVSGVVSDNAGLPLPGVSVLVKGTKTGTQTDFDGKYTIKTTPTQILIFSYIGMKNQEIAASSTKINVKLVNSTVELEGVVVTALGITREKKSLGYAAQKLSGSEINQAPTNNFTNSLSGRVAGLEDRRNSNFGGSTNIVLRGTKSTSGNNQALIVLDGVPITNTNLNTKDATNGRDGFDFGNSASDIDPNNIESVTVLKGAAATALYGSQAANGAIMITTKKGKQGKGMGITYSSTTSVGMINKKTFPTYQKKYGQGYAGPDSFFIEDVNGDNNPDFLTPTGDDASYGNEFDPELNVFQWNSFVEGNPNFGLATPWVAAKNDPSKFFDKSSGYINSININGGDDKSTYNFGFTNNYETGTLPNSRLNRNVINGNFSRNLSDKLKVTAFLTYSDQTTKGRNNIGYGDNLMTGFRQWWPVNIDINELKSEYFRTNSNTTWNFADPLNGNFTPAYWNNPYWDRYKNFSSDDRTRVITGSSLIFDVTKNLNVLGRVTVESSNDRQEMRKAIGSHAEEFGLSQINETSGYNLYTRSFLQSTYDFITTFDKRLTNDLGIKILGGTSFIKANTDEFEGSTTGGLASPGLFTLANSNVFVAPEEEEYKYEKFGLYGQFTFDFKKSLYLEGSYRLDNSTALPKNNDTYGYFSLGSSFVFSEFTKIDWLSLGKLRLSYAEVGNDPAYGTLGARVNNGLVGSNPTFGNSAVFVDFENLKPEIQKTWEFGIEAEMFNKRLNLDFSVYKTNTFNQIFNVPQSTSTGYSFSQINAGELQNNGVEIALSGYPIKTNDFKWMVGVNWSKNKNELVKLDEGRSNLQLASFQDGVSLNATAGQPYGTLRGTDFVYDDNGNKVIDADGFYLSDSDKVIGNIQADWIAGITNRFTYKNLAFNFLIDIKQGGDVFSLDQSYGQYTGLYAESAINNDLGNPIRNPLTAGADSGGVILPGVLEDGTPNTIRIDASTAGAAYGSGAAPNKAFIYDASYVKLREIGINYNFSPKLLDKTFITGASIGITGSNLWIIHKNLPYSDPEAGNSAGNVQGYQSGVMPSEKVYAFNVKINF